MRPFTINPIARRCYRDCRRSFLRNEGMSIISLLRIISVAKDDVMDPITRDGIERRSGDNEVEDGGVPNKC